MFAAIAFGAGLMLDAYGKQKANLAEANAERRNAAFYREQADYARKTGERQQMIFDRESVILHGDQTSAFASSGVDVTAGAGFIAQQMFYRQQESSAIKAEADFNVRLAMMKAGESESRARYLGSFEANFIPYASAGLSAAGKAYGG